MGLMVSSQPGCGLAQGGFLLARSVPALERHLRQDWVRTTPNEVGWRHYVQPCTQSAAIQLAGVMWKADKSSRGLCVLPSCSAPPPPWPALQENPDL